MLSKERDWSRRLCPEAYGPERAQQVRPTPYSQGPLTDDDKSEFTVDVDMMPNNHLPPGWKSENGQDEWRLDGNFLTKMHKTSRNKEFTPTEQSCPVPLHFLTKQRMTKMTSGKLVRDKWTRSTPCKSLSHRGVDGVHTVQPATPWRKDAKDLFQNKSYGAETIYLKEDKSNAQVSEPTLSFSDRLAFREA